MKNAKLMSYNQIDFQSKFHMEAMIRQMEKVNEELGYKFKEGMSFIILASIENRFLNSSFGYPPSIGLIFLQSNKKLNAWRETFL